MSFSLYFNNESYYLIIQKGIDWNIVMEFGNFTTRCINNDELDKMEKLEFNSTNINKVIGNNYNIDTKNFDENHYIYINNKWFYVDNWQSLFNIINSK